MEFKGYVLGLLLLFWLDIFLHTGYISDMWTRKGRNNRHLEKKKTGQSLNRFKISLIYYHFTPCYLFVFILLDSSHDCDLFKMLNWKRSQNLTIIFMSSMIHWYDCNLFKMLWQQQQKCMLVFKLCLEWCLKGVWTPCLKKYLMYFHWQFCLKSMWNSNPKYSWVKI